MLEHLFGSKTRLKLLRLFFRDPEKSYFVREITRLLDTQINAVRRELGLLIEAGIVREIDKEIDPAHGHAGPIGESLRKYYSLNKESILYSELQALLIKAQILGEQQFVKEVQEKAGDISLLLLTGRFTGDKHAPTDLLIVGKIHERVLGKLITDHEKEFGFEIRYTVMAPQEFHDRRHIMDKFLYGVFEAKHMKVVDTLM